MASYYAQKSDLLARYGEANLERMADPDGTGLAATQDAHIDLALRRADMWIRGNLRRSLYSTALASTSGQLVDRDGAVPADLTHIAVLWAGWVLSTAHGIRDYDKDGRPISNQYADKLEAEQLMKEIREGQTYLMDVEC